MILHKCSSSLTVTAWSHQQRQAVWGSFSSIFVTPHLVTTSDFNVLISLYSTLLNVSGVNIRAVDLWPQTQMWSLTELPIWVLKLSGWCGCSSFRCITSIKLVSVPHRRGCFPERVQTVRGSVTQSLGHLWVKWCQVLHNSTNHNREEKKCDFNPLRSKAEDRTLGFLNKSASV